MAPKQAPLYQRTPSPVSSSDEGDEEIPEVEGGNEDQNLNHKKRPSEESEVEEEEDDEEEEEEEEEEHEEEKEESEEDVPISAVKKPSNQKPPLTQIPPKSKSSSESESEAGSDSETESEKTIHSPSASDFTVKPSLSKPMDNSSKSKKPNSKSSASSVFVSKPGSKRPSLSEQRGSGKEENKKRKVDEENGAVEEKKPHGLTRLWSEDDEIALLNGMLEYQSKRGADPYADLGAFHEFIKKSLHFDVSKNQLTDKIRRLKKKYQNNAEKGENGEDPVFSRPHEVQSFEISKKVWGGGPSSNGVDDNAKSTNGKATRKNVKVNNNSQPPLKEPKRKFVLKDGTKVEGKSDQEEFWSLYPHLKESLELRGPSLLSDSGRNFIKENMKLIGNAKAKSLEETWKNLQVKEVELFMKHIDLIQEQTGLVLDAVMHSSS